MNNFIIFNDNNKKTHLSFESFWVFIAIDLLQTRTIYFNLRFSRTGRLLLIKIDRTVIVNYDIWGIH